MLQLSVLKKNNFLIIFMDFQRICFICESYLVGKDVELMLYVCSCFSPNQRLLAVSLLDCTVKILFADTLKVSIAY